MTELRIQADGFQVGDHVDIDGRLVEIRHLERDASGKVTVNPGDDDQLGGCAWQNATVQREEAP